MKKLLLPLLGTTLCFAMIGLLLVEPDRYETVYGEILHETTSDFSHIRVRQRGAIRSLLFVDDDGSEQRQSAISMDNPEELQLSYTRSLFVSFLFRHPQERVLIVGLGGGGMVRYLNQLQPETHVDSVEIDPAVVQIAADYFDTKPGPKTSIFTADAFVYLKETETTYDAIYMDAFLRPPDDSGLETVTERLKTVNFLKSLHPRLKPKGLVAFNLIEVDPSTDEDLEAMKEAFPNVYIFSAPKSGNLAVIASLDPERLSKETLMERAVDFAANTSLELDFEDLVIEYWD